MAAETAAAASHAEEAMQVDASPSRAGVGAAVATELGRAVATSETSSAVGGWRVEEVGPSLDLVLRRTHLPAADLWKRACHTPKPVRVSSAVVMYSGVLLVFTTLLCTYAAYSYCRLQFNSEVCIIWTTQLQYTRTSYCIACAFTRVQCVRSVTCRCWRSDSGSMAAA